MAQTVKDVLRGVQVVRNIDRLRQGLVKRINATGLHASRLE